MSIELIILIVVIAIVIGYYIARKSEVEVEAEADLSMRLFNEVMDMHQACIEKRILCLVPPNESDKEIGNAHIQINLYNNFNDRKYTISYASRLNGYVEKVFTGANLESLLTEVESYVQEKKQKLRGASHSENPSTEEGRV